MLKLSGRDALLVFMTGVFAIAGVGRLVFHADRQEERRALYPALPWLEWVVPVAELLLAAALLSPKTRRVALQVALVGVCVYTAVVLARHHPRVLASFHEVITYKPTAMCTVLHLTYAAILASLLLP